MESQRVIVMGPTGCGKTTLVKRLVGEIRNRVVFVADPNQRYVCRKRFYRAEDMADFFEQTEKIPFGVYCATFSSALDWEAFFIIVGAVSGASEVPPRENYPTVLVIDELADFSDAKSTDEALYHFIRYGRHASVWLFYCSMQGRNINRLLLSNAATIICFRLPEDDLAHLQECVSIVDVDFSDVRDLQTLTKTEYPNVEEGKHYLVFGEGQSTDAKKTEDEEKPERDLA